MLASIHPFGERARHNRWGRTAAAYLAGSVAGGSALGGALGLAGGTGLRGHLSGPAVAVAIAAISASAAAFDARLGGLRLPSVRRQVNEDWMQRYRGWIYGIGFGTQLGAGVVTVVTTASVYLAFALAALSGSAVAGMVVGATFGLVRAAPVLALARVREPAQLRRVHRAMQARSGAVARSTLVALVVVAAGAAASA